MRTSFLPQVAGVTELINRVGIVEQNQSGGFAGVIVMMPPFSWVHDNSDGFLALQIQLLRKVKDFLGLPPRRFLHQISPSE